MFEVNLSDGVYLGVVVFCVLGLILHSIFSKTR